MVQNQVYLGTIDLSLELLNNYIPKHVLLYLMYTNNLGLYIEMPHK